MLVLHAPEPPVSGATPESTNSGSAVVASTSNGPTDSCAVEKLWTTSTSSSSSVLTNASVRDTPVVAVNSRRPPLRSASEPWRAWMRFR